MDNRTWHDQRPSHKPVPPAVRAADAKNDIAWGVRNDFINYCLDNHEWNQRHIDELTERAEAAYDELLQAKYDALNPCPHKHVSMVGGQHFDAGEVWDDIQEVCQDCGMVLGGE